MRRLRRLNGLEKAFHVRGLLRSEQEAFASVPSVEQYFPGTAIEGALQVLGRCIERAEGAGLVVGPSGTGKTLLCLMLEKQFRGFVPRRAAFRRTLGQPAGLAPGDPFPSRPALPRHGRRRVATGDPRIPVQGRRLPAGRPAVGGRGPRALPAAAGRASHDDQRGRPRAVVCAAGAGRRGGVGRTACQSEAGIVQPADRRPLLPGIVHARADGRIPPGADYGGGRIGVAGLCAGGGPGGLRGDRRRPAADQPALRSRLIVGLQRRAAAGPGPSTSRRPGPTSSSCLRPGTPRPARSRPRRQ